MTGEVYPVVLIPHVLEKPWGGRGWEPEFAPGNDPALKVGEVWLTADGDRQSIISNGPMTGRTMADLRRDWGVDLLGRRLAGREDQPLPLLLKLIHAADYLSVQVHPDSRAATRLEGRGPGKTEAWCIIEAEVGAELILGLKPGLDRKDIRMALESERVEEILNRVRVRPGQVHYIHAGRLHAIGPGVTLFEIQPNSDVTYRFNDWGRVDTQGCPRELHLAKAIEVADLEAVPCEPFDGLTFHRDGARVTALAAGRHFGLERWEVKGSWAGRLDGARFEILFPISGHGFIQTFGSRRDTGLAPGRAVLLPATLGGFRIEAPDGIVFFRAWLPDLETEIVEPLLAAGFTSAEIVRLAGSKESNDLSALVESSARP